MQPLSERHTYEWCIRLFHTHEPGVPFHSKHTDVGLALSHRLQHDSDTRHMAYQPHVLLRVRARRALERAELSTIGDVFKEHYAYCGYVVSEVDSKARKESVHPYCGPLCGLHIQLRGERTCDRCHTFVCSSCDTKHGHEERYKDTSVCKDCADSLARRLAAALAPWKEHVPQNLTPRHAEDLGTVLGEALVPRALPVEQAALAASFVRTISTSVVKGASSRDVAVAICHRLNKHVPYRSPSYFMWLRDVANLLCEQVAETLC